MQYEEIGSEHLWTAAFKQYRHFIPSTRQVYLCLYATFLVPPARAGAFAANFTPDTLNRFRDLCKQHGRQYTKVLERLAEIYLASNGEVLNSSYMSLFSESSRASNASIELAPFNDLMKRLDQVEGDYRIADKHLEFLIQSLDKRLSILEK